MKSKGLLFELIQSLSKSEKRYFKVFTSSHKENNNYVKLFDAIHAQKEYDETLILKQFENEDFVRQFSVAKNYLLSLILKSLSNFHSKAKKSIELNDYLTEIEILYWKGLYKLSSKRIKQGKKIAEKYQMTHYLLLLNYWERRVEDYVNPAVMDEEMVNKAKSYLKQFNEELEMNFLLKKMENFTKGSLKLNNDAKEKVREVFENRLLKMSFEEISSFSAKLDYLFLKGTGNTVLVNKEEELIIKKKIVEFLEDNPHQIKENPLKYGAALNNILLYFYYQKYTHEYPIYLEKIDSVELKFDHAKGQFLDTKFIFEIGYYIHVRDKENVSRSLLAMEESYSKSGERKNPQTKMICEFNMALTNFFVDNRKKCLRWCSSCFSLFDMKTKKFRHDLAVSIVVLQILVYLDLGYFDMAQKHLSIALDIAKSNKYEESEIAIFGTIEKMIKSQNPNEYLQEFKMVIDESSDHFSLLDKDVLVLWLEKRLNPS